MIQFKKRAPISSNNKTSLMEQLLKQEIPVASSCDGEGVCGMCRISILEGEENLSPLSKQEEKFFKENNFPQNIRLSCQTYVFGDILVDTDYW